MKLGFSLGPCVRDMLKGKVKDEDIGFILVGEYFSWNSHPDDFQAVLQDHLMLKQFDEDIVYDTIDLLHFSGKLVKTTNGDMSSFWIEFSQKNRETGVLWCDVVVSPEISTPAVKSAWEHYQIVAGLCK
tara:strand:+ start:237 stop:623 length:387 start_codon:yes stop_codon:yes gene_type:complete